MRLLIGHCKFKFNTNKEDFEKPRRKSILNIYKKEIASEFFFVIDIFCFCCNDEYYNIKMYLKNIVPNWPKVEFSIYLVLFWYSTPIRYQ